MGGYGELQSTRRWYEFSFDGGVKRRAGRVLRVWCLERNAGAFPNQLRAKIELDVDPERRIEVNECKVGISQATELSKDSVSPSKLFMTPQRPSLPTICSVLARCGP